MCSIFVILKLLSKISFGRTDVIKRPEVMNMFSMLFLSPEPTPPPPKCHDWSVISELIPEANRKDIAAVLIRLLNLNLPMSTWKMADWVFVIPLIDLLEKRTKPFARPAMTSRDIQWKLENHVNFPELRSQGVSAVLG